MYRRRIAGSSSCSCTAAHAFPNDPLVRCASSTRIRSHTSTGRPYSPECASISTGKEAYVAYTVTGPRPCHSASCGALVVDRTSSVYRVGSSTLAELGGGYRGDVRAGLQTDGV
jgi:hypothetical protein